MIEFPRTVSLECQPLDVHEFREVFATLQLLKYANKHYLYLGSCNKRFSVNLYTNQGDTGSSQ